MVGAARRGGGATGLGDRPGTGALAAAGRGRAVFRSLTETVQYAAGIVAICMVAVLCWVFVSPGSFIGRVLLNANAIAAVILFIVFIHARLASLIAANFGVPMHGVAAAGSGFGGVWDRELDG